VKRQPKLTIIFYLISMIVSSSKKTTSFKIKVKIGTRDKKIGYGQTTNMHKYHLIAGLNLRNKI
jgi:hypothetical protein